MGDTDDAIDLLKKTCYLERDYDAAWFLLLDTLTKKGDYAEAEHIGKLALKEIPHTKSRSVRAILGKVAALQNKLEIAVNYFESVIGLDPKTEAEDYYNLGIIYSLVKRETDAIEAIKKSLQIKPNSENSLTALKNIQSKLKN
uniref:Anaphase-promoting complex subunit CDC16-like n=1 Tax=Saccoglossus kowalevskii TaxID=10224 RepID=A0ABM0MD52_SACKO|nr:PREDICTED: anaphase-promoting complex subunit CDC16-like [Saccoglossus kowalevskii]